MWLKIVQMGHMGSEKNWPQGYLPHISSETCREVPHFSGFEIDKSVFAGRKCVFAWRKQVYLFQIQKKCGTSRHVSELM